MTTAPTVAPPLQLSTHQPQRGVVIYISAALLIVAAVLGFAAYMKLTTAELMFDRVQAIIEVAFVAYLAVFRTRWWGWASATMLFSAFAGYTGYLLYRGESSCGCFGAIETPPINTLMLDIGLMTLAGVATLLLGKSKNLPGILLTLAGVGAIAGTGFSVLSTTPLPGSFHGDRISMLLAAPELSDVAENDLANPDWLVFIYDDAADSDENTATLETMRADEATHADDEALRVRILTTAQTAEMSGVPEWAWEKLPMAILFRAGSVIRRYTPETDFETPDSIRQTRPVGPIAQVLAQPQYADILAGVDDLPIHIVYVYNPECPICIEHLVVLDTFEEEYPDDSNVLITTISMDDIEKDLGLQKWVWPGIPTTYVVRAGRVIHQGAGPNGIPNPYQIRMDLAQGKPLVLPKTN